MERSVLLAKNPWWKGKEHFKEDEDYIKWGENKVKWIPEILNNIGVEPFSLHFVFGPRQVGKTTILKLLIKKILESEMIKPEQIFYFRCDEVKDYKELEEILEAYFELREEQEIKNSYIFLDEITFADEWFRTIKGKIDGGDFKKDVLIITGSTSFEVLKHTEYFPGRRGKGRDFFVFPLSFREFIKVMNLELYGGITKLESLEEKEIIEKSKKNSLYLKEINKLFNLYLKIGGFPLAINSYSEKKEIDSSVKNIYLNWIKNDIVKVNKHIDISREILKSLITKIPSPISWEKISKETSIKSPKTINSYVHMFEDLFLLNISHYINLNNLTIEFGKNKKIHLMDPLFYEIFEEWCLVEIKEKENKKAENILASHLASFGRKYKEYFENVFYWQNNIEIDIIIRTKTNAIGFEVKWANKVAPLRVIAGKMKQVYVLSKEKYDLKNKIIPLSLFLCMLDI